MLGVLGAPLPACNHMTPGTHLAHTYRRVSRAHTAVVDHRVETVEDLVAYHVVFIPASAEEQIGTILEALGDSPTLTVGETDGFATRGGVMNFVIVKNKVRFEINMQAADRAGLKISSQLLRVGILVRDLASERGP